MLFIIFVLWAHYIFNTNNTQLFVRYQIKYIIYCWFVFFFQWESIQIKDVHIIMCVVLYNKVLVFIFHRCRLACYFCEEKMTFYIYILLYTSRCKLIFCHPIWISEIKIKHKNKEQISERVRSIVQCTTDWKIVFDDHEEKRLRLARRGGCGCFSVCSNTRWSFLRIR